MNCRKAVLTAMAAAMMTFFSGCGQTQVGYVDVSRVEEEAPQMKAVSDEAQKKISEAEQEIENQIAAKEDVSEEEAMKALDEGQRKIMNLRQMYATQFKQKLDVALGQIAREKNLDAVFESHEHQTLVYYGGIDITDEVIARLQ